VLDLLVDDRGEQPGGELGVVRLLGDERGRGADRQVVEVLGRGAVDEAGDGPGGDAHRVDVLEALRAPGNGADDLVQVDGLEAAVALSHPHLDAGVLLGRRVDDLDVPQILLKCHVAVRSACRSAHLAPETTRCGGPPGSEPQHLGAQGCNYSPVVTPLSTVTDRWDGDCQEVARWGVGPATRGGASGPAAPSPGLRAGQAGGTVLRRVAPIPPGPRRRPTV